MSVPDMSVRHFVMVVGEYHTMDRAPCGVTLVSVDHTKVHHSANGIEGVTCTTCQKIVANASKAYTKARRAKKVNW